MALSDYAPIFQSAGQQYGVDPNLLMAMASMESSGNPNAVSPQGASGLMQFMPDTARALGLSNPNDPSQAIPAAAKLLVQNAHQFGGPAEAVLAYHGGTNPQNWGPKTRAYLAKVSNAYQQLKNGNPVASTNQNQTDNDAFSAAFGSGTQGSASAPSQEAQDAFSAAFGNTGTPAKTTPSKAPQKAPAKVSGSTAYIANRPFGFSDEVMARLPFAKDAVAGGLALVDAAGNRLTGQNGPPLGQTYQNNLAALNQQQKAYEAAHPVLSPAAGVLGLFGAGAPTAATANVATQTLPQMIKSGAKAGATLGALFGVGTPSEQGDFLGGRAANALTGAATGAVTGSALPVIGTGLVAAARPVGNAINKLFPSMNDAADAKARGLIEQFAGGQVPLVNDAQIVPGSQPTLPETSGNAGVAGLYRAMRDANPNSPLVAREAENAAARKSFLEGATGVPEDIEAAAAARDKAASAQLGQIFGKNTQQADVAPVRQQIQDILNGPSGARPAVKSAMQDVQNILDNGGKPITDPETLYNSARKGIDDLISGKDLTKAYGAQAARELLSVKDKLDDAIEGAAPGFKQYLSDYSSASGPISSMKFLQGLNLTDTKGNVTLGNVQRAIKRLDAQQAAPGAKAADAVTDTQRDALIALRDDLLRSQNTSLGKAIGSNTVQNAINQSKIGGLSGKTSGLIQNFAAPAGAGLGGAVGGLTGLPGGAEVGAGIGGYFGNRLAQSAAAKTAAGHQLVQQRIEDMLLNPSSYYSPPPVAPAPTLNEIMNGARARNAIGLANRLAILHETRREAGAR